MKDALGHGSNAKGTHSEGVDQIGRVSTAALAKLSTQDGSVRPDGSEPTKGYMVSHEGHEMAVPLEQMQGAGAHAIINKYAADHAAALSTKGAHLGRWTDHDSGKVYLDVSQNIKNKHQAITTGRARNQLAIWDLKRGRRDQHRGQTLMAEPITVSNEQAATALAHKHPKSKGTPKMEPFPGNFGGSAPGANGPPTTGGGGTPPSNPWDGQPAVSDNI